MAVENPYDISSYAVLTPQQLLELIFGIIIDNNEEFITPARLRMVLLPIVSSYAGRGSAISGQAPISVNQFNGIISIAKASATQDGYISKEDFAAAMSGGITPYYSEFTFSENPITVPANLKIMSCYIEQGSHIKPSEREIDGTELTITNADLEVGMVVTIEGYTTA